MGSLNVHMPDELRSYVDDRTKAGGFGTPTEYVRPLIRKDRDEAGQRLLTEQLTRGRESREAKGDVKALFRRVQAHVDRVERESKKAKPSRAKKTRRPKGDRRP
ncbi:MAG: type II toxin-antitoxin system ParD family antitoxin [Candidatus Binatia bacterium]